MKNYDVDPVRFIENNFSLGTPYGQSSFELRDYQRLLLTDFTVHRRNIILKSRQVGATTLMIAYALWRILEENDKKIIMITLNRNMVDRCIDIAKNMLKDFNFSVKDDAINFANGGTFIITHDHKNRLDDVSLVMFDECSYLQDAEGMLSCMLSNDVDCIMMSTPGKQDSYFCKFYVDALLEKNSFRAKSLTARDASRTQLINNTLPLSVILHEYFCQFQPGDVT